MGEIGPHNTHLELDATPMAGVYPNQGGGADPFAAFRPPTCRTVTYCDAASFEVKYPKSYLREVFFGITIELTWDNPKTKNNETGNDVDLFVWGDDGPASGGPLSKCGSPTDPAEPPEGETDETARCNYVYPEVVSISEPPDTTAEDADPVAIFITIVNHTGVNTGYQINVDWFTFELPPPPKFEQPEREISGQASPTVSGPFNFDVTDVSPGNPTPVPTPRKILVPGPGRQAARGGAPDLRCRQPSRVDGRSQRNAPVGHRRHRRRDNVGRLDLLLGAQEQAGDGGLVRRSFIGMGILLLLLCTTLVGAVAPAPVAALDQGSLGTISPKKTHLELDGPPLAGVLRRSGRRRVRNDQATGVPSGDVLRCVRVRGRLSEVLRA